MKNMEINERDIGDEEPTFIIAEAGINHNGKIRTAKKLIQEAGKADADAVKFQMFKTEGFCSKNSEYFDLFKSLEFNDEEWLELAEFARKSGITFTASVLDKESADLLGVMGSPVYKMASGDLTHLSLLNHVAKKNNPIILSTGMSTTREIEEAIGEIYKTGNHQVALLHCVSEYPTKPEEMNLTVIQTLKNVFKVPVGLSDHTIGTLIPSIAVAVGASIIEKHFTLNKDFSGPDHKLSLEPSEFQKMVKKIRTVESALGDGIKRPTEDEESTRKLARRSITAKVNIPKGAVITKNMIKIVRPGIGVEPKFVNSVVGRVAKRKIAEDEVVRWGDL
jgi:N,N'-diacetyllegionaminate synthase